MYSILLVLLFISVLTTAIFIKVNQDDKNNNICEVTAESIYGGDYECNYESIMTLSCRCHPKMYFDKGYYLGNLTEFKKGELNE